MDLEAQRTLTYVSVFGAKLCVSAVTYPFEYAKFLIQIGHEPLPSYMTRTFFGRPVEALPNIFEYVKYIKNTDGYFGCYRGFGLKMTGQVLTTVISPTIKEYVEDFFPNKAEVNADQKRSCSIYRTYKIKMIFLFFFSFCMLVLAMMVSVSSKRDLDVIIDRWCEFKKQLAKDIINKSVTVIMSQPFVVISSRIMAEFVGGEEIYNGMYISVKEILKRDGILGFFSGLIPRWIGEISSVILASFIIYGVNNYILQDQEIKSIAVPTVQYLCNTLTYPYLVVSACMTVNNCGLAAGVPPQMPYYDSWTHCWRHLYQTGQINRGSSTLIRYVPRISRKLAY